MTKENEKEQAEQRNQSEPSLQGVSEEVSRLQDRDQGLGTYTILTKAREKLEKANLTEHVKDIDKELGKMPLLTKIKDYIMSFIRDEDSKMKGIEEQIKKYSEAKLNYDQQSPQNDVLQKGQTQSLSAKLEQDVRITEGLEKTFGSKQPVNANPNSPSDPTTAELAYLVDATSKLSTGLQGFTDAKSEKVNQPDGPAPTPEKGPGKGASR